MSNETMLMETKTMEFTTEPGQTVLIDSNIRLNAREFRAKNGRLCLKLFIQLPKEMDVYQTKRSFEELSGLSSKKPTKSDVLRMVQKMMMEDSSYPYSSSSQFDKEGVCEVKVKKKRVQASTDSPRKSSPRMRD